jgi:formyltetrahydrofolate deformylase
MTWQINDSAVKKRVVVLVSKQEHCLYDLLARWQSKELDIEIPCIISNHDTFKGFVEWHGIPFIHVPVTPDNKQAAYAEIQRIFDDVRGDTMVLARYMQILSPELCEALSGRIINIHHSFLPSFAGAKPYHQAYTRGVKLIGATCHYVTSELDAGPIVEQDVIRIDHSDSPEDMVRYGKDIEKTVLARGLRYHLEDLRPARERAGVEHPHRARGDVHRDGHQDQGPHRPKAARRRDRDLDRAQGAQKDGGCRSRCRRGRCPRGDRRCVTPVSCA